MNEDMNDLPSQVIQEVIARLDIPNSNVWVRQEHFIDRMNLYGDGNYEYDMYYFTDEIYFVLARSYIDEPEEASFKGLMVNRVRRFLKKDDFQLPFMKTAVDYLLSIGKTNLKWLDRNNNQGGYSRVPFIHNGRRLEK